MLYRLAEIEGLLASEPGLYVRFSDGFAADLESGGGSGDKRFGWLLRGTVAGRGPDGEPLIADVEVIGRLADCLLDEAQHIYRERFLSGLSVREAQLVAVAHA